MPDHSVQLVHDSVHCLQVMICTDCGASRAPQAIAMLSAAQEIRLFGFVREQGLCASIWGALHIGSVARLRSHLRPRAALRQFAAAPGATQAGHKRRVRQLMNCAEFVFARPRRPPSLPQICRRSMLQQACCILTAGECQLRQRSLKHPLRLNSAFQLGLLC